LGPPNAHLGAVAVKSGAASSTLVPREGPIKFYTIRCRTNGGHGSSSYNVWVRESRKKKLELGVVG